MSKHSVFASFADAAEKPRPVETIRENSTQMTVEELLDTLQKLVRKDPSIKNKRVFHVEFGMANESRQIDMTEKGLVISGND